MLLASFYCSLSGQRILKGSILSAEGPSSTRNLSRLFLETNRGVVDRRTRPEANAKDKPKRNLEKCHTAP